MYLSKENTWMQHLRKDQYIKGTKTIKDPLIRHSQAFLSEKFSEFDYTNDAIFESFRDYPRKKHLYRKHKDIAKDYERKVKFYKSCQRWYSTESNRQIQNAEERFSKLLEYTFASNIKKTNGLRRSYSKWVSMHGKLTDFDKSFEQTVHGKHETLQHGIHEEKEKVETPAPVGSSLEKLHGIRSVSLDNIPQVEENSRLTGFNSRPETRIEEPQMLKSLSNMDIHRMDNGKTKRSKKTKYSVKIISH